MDRCRPLGTLVSPADVGLLFGLPELRRSLPAYRWCTEPVQTLNDWSVGATMLVSRLYGEQCRTNQLFSTRWATDRRVEFQQDPGLASPRGLFVLRRAKRLLRSRLCLAPGRVEKNLAPIFRPLCKQRQVDEFVSKFGRTRDFWPGKNPSLIYRNERLPPNATRPSIEEYVTSKDTGRDTRS